MKRASGLARCLDEKIVELGMHQAEPWQHAQRLILVVVDRPDPKTGQLELRPRHFFLVMNWPVRKKAAEQLLEHYRRRGTFEDRFGELSQAISPRLSSPEFAENELNFLLSLLSYNLLSILRGELECGSMDGWDVARVQHTVLKTAARVVKGGHRLFLDIAFAAAGLWTWLFERMEKWSAPAPPRERGGSKRRKWVPPPAHAFLGTVLRL